jgi:hypothetical protein
VQLAGTSYLASLRQTLITALRVVGLTTPQVTTIQVAGIEHTSVAAKLKRFVPLISASPALSGGSRSAIEQRDDAAQGWRNG